MYALNAVADTWRLDSQIVDKEKVVIHSKFAMICSSTHENIYSTFISQKAS